MPSRLASGFTLLELIIVIVMVGLVAAIAVPSMGRLMDEQRAHVDTQRLLFSLSLARSNALSQRMVTAVCRSSTGLGCTTDQPWHGGWIVFESPSGVANCADTDGDGFCDGHGGRILHVEQRSANNRVAIVHNSNVADRVRFNEVGMTPGYNGRFTVCGAHGNGIRGIVIAMTGRVRPAREAEFLPCEQG